MLQAPSPDNLCLGDTALLPVTVRVQAVESVGAGEIGSVTIRGVTFDTTNSNPSVVEIGNASPGESSPDTPFQTRISLIGREVGSTTITITATVQSDVVVALDEEVALPIPSSSQTQSISVPVRVVVCEYNVNINTIWDTSMHGASTVLVATAHNLRLTAGRTPNGRTLRFDPPIAGAPFLGWTWAMNRIRGCWASIGYFPDRAPQITAEIGDENLILTMTYWEVAPPLRGYYNQLCLPYHAGEPCSSRPDGACWAMPPNRPLDFFRPESPAGALSVPLDGGTIDTTQRITHSYGSATGTIHITVTPVRRSP